MANFKDEIWVDIPSYEGKYLISNYGRIISKRRNGLGRDILVSINKSGRYCRVGLRDKKRIHYSVHRLVASAFIPNPNGFPQVDHINGDTYDNRVSNLRWVTAKANQNNPVTVSKRRISSLKRRNNHQSKVVIQKDKEDNVIATFPSIREAERQTGIHRTNISDAARGKRKWIIDHWATNQTAGGYKWEIKK